MVSQFYTFKVLEILGILKRVPKVFIDEADCITVPRCTVASRNPANRYYLPISAIFFYVIHFLVF